MFDFLLKIFELAHIPTFQSKKLKALIIILCLFCENYFRLISLLCYIVLFYSQK